MRPWQDVTVQFVVPGALHATFYNNVSAPIATSIHFPFSASVPAAQQVRYRGYLKLPYIGDWSIQFIGCTFTLGAARFDGVKIAADSVSGTNSTIKISITEQSLLHDFVFHCSNFSVTHSSVKFFHSHLNSTSSFQPSVYAGFNVLAKTFYGQGLWATYYDSIAMPRVASPSQFPSQSFSPSNIKVLYTHFAIRWSGFIQVNSSRVYTFAFRCGAHHISSLKINDRIASSFMDDVSGTVNILLLTMFLHSVELHEIDISIQFMPYFMTNFVQQAYELLWIERSQPSSSIASQLIPFPLQSLFSSISSSKVIANDMLQFSWSFPLETRVVEGMPLARGKGLDRYNSPLLLVVNSGYICAATSSFSPSTFVTVMTAGVATSLLFTSRDEFANVAESVPIMSLWGVEKSRSHSVSATMSSEHTSSTTTLLLPPITNSLIAQYTADSFSSASRIWNDISGNGNHATEIGGTISVVRPVGSAPYIQGGPTSSITFPETVLPSSYTLFYVARYNGASRQRIFRGLTTNWLSGFWANKAGVAHHGCWITPQTDYHGTNWVTASDRAHSFRSNGVRRSTTASCHTSTRLTINAGGEPSDFAVQIVLVYNRSLSDSEVTSVESWMSVFSLISHENLVVRAPSSAQVALSFFTTLSGQIVMCVHQRCFNLHFRCVPLCCAIGGAHIGRSECLCVKCNK